ncbi:MAG: hypothetical protein ACXVPD_03655, partial [Bacteroidia bacterium]
MTACLVLSFTAFFYSPILFHPSAYILNDTGDAIKNYYCYQWHVQNDSSFINYTGTNYPYGELHAYTDGNPLLGNFIKLVPFLKPWSVALFNLSLILSFLFCALLLVKIFREFEVPALLNCIASTGIAILCPQMMRLAGHLALSYSFTIPLIIYILILFEKKERKLFHSLLLAFFLLCFFFIHQYLGMIASSFVFLYWTVRFFTTRGFIPKSLFLFFIQSICPVLFYFLYLKFTDTHQNRPSDPYGFMYFTANIESIFISTMPPFRHFLSLIYKIRIQNWEGAAYVGVTTLIALFYTPFLLYKKKSILKTKLQDSISLRILFCMATASVILLLFSMAYPFKWNMEWLLGYFPFVKQFRAPGRFAWVFFFVITILSTIIISKHFFIRLPETLRLTLCALLLVLFSIEGIPFHKALTKHLFVANCFAINRVDTDLLNIMSRIKKGSAQAIIPLPFFHIGTDYYNFEATNKIRKAAFVLSYHTNLPLMANPTPRTSFTESEKLIQIISNDLIEKPIKHDVDSLKSFLILYSKDKLSDEESLLLEKGELITETGGYILKEISYKDLFANQVQKKKNFFLANKNRMQYTQGHFITDTSYFLFLNYDSLPHGRLEDRFNEGTPLFYIAPNMLEKNKIYELTFWYSGPVNNTLLVKENDLVIKTRNIDCMPNIVEGKMVATITFKAEHPEYTYSFSLNEDPA